MRGLKLKSGCKEVGMKKEEGPKSFLSFLSFFLFDAPTRKKKTRTKGRREKPAETYKNSRVESAVQLGRISSKVAMSNAWSRCLQEACSLGRKPKGSRGLRHMQVPQGAGMRTQQAQQLCHAVVLPMVPAQRAGGVIVVGVADHLGRIAAESKKKKHSLSRQNATPSLRSIFGQACGSSSMGWPSVQSHTHWSAWASE